MPTILRPTSGFPVPQTQLTLLLELDVTHGLSAGERRAAITALAALLAEASGQTTEPTDER